MKKQYPTTKKARSASGWHKHLKPAGKRVANKGTRKVMGQEIEMEVKSFLEARCEKEL